MKKNNPTDHLKTNIGKISAAFVIIGALTSCGANAQSMRDLIKNKTAKDTTNKGGNSNNLLNRLSKKIGGNSAALSSAEVAEGLKAALEQGVTKGTLQLSSLDGYLGNAAIKILMPPEAKKVEETLRKLGMGKQVDQAITSMNRAAEDAAKNAAPIFLNAIKEMTIQDAFAILSGKEDAATQYLKGQTTQSLTRAFRPVIENSLEKVDATKYWNMVFTNYNKFSPDKINPDLPEYVTDKALMGLFQQLALEEANIRKNPAARTSEILKKVFSN